MTTLPEFAVLCDLVRAGETAATIGRRYGVDRGAVFAAFTRHDTSIKSFRPAPAGKTPRPKGREKLPPLEQLATQLREGVSVAELAGQYHVRQQTIYDAFSAAGQPVRTLRGAGLLPRLVAGAQRQSPGWQASAQCRTADPELFFSETAHDEDAAKAVCRQCPVRHECLAENLDQRWGVFGAATAGERAVLRRRASRLAAGVAS